MLDLKNVTACLITRERAYPQEIKLDGFGEVLIRTESPSVFNRYLLAQSAKHDVIYVQDDDAIVDYRELAGHYRGNITNCMTEHHIRAYQHPSWGGATLVGWGCFFPKSALSVFEEYIEKYGVDAHLLREADRIFTVLNQPHDTIIRAHVDIGRQDVGRMWNETEHWVSAQEAIVKAKGLV